MPENKVKPPERRRHSADFKAAAVKAALVPGASLAAVAQYEVSMSLF